MGHFAFDSVPAERHALVLMHPLLDSLDIALAPMFVGVPNAGDVTIALSTPSVRSLNEALCGATLRDGAGLLIGRSSRGDDTRLDSGSVRISRTEMEIVQTRVVRVPRSISLALHTGATFVACDVPLRQPIRVEASTSSGSSSPVEISISDVAFRHLPIHVRQGQYQLTFSVTANTGLPIQKAGVSSSDARGKMRTDATARATLMLTAGTQSIRVLKVGFEAHIRLLDVARDTLVAVTMHRAGVALTTKRIVGQSGASLPAGCGARRRARFGVVLGPEVIEALGGMSFVRYCRTREE